MHAVAAGEPNDDDERGTFKPLFGCSPQQENDDSDHEDEAACASVLNEARQSGYEKGYEAGRKEGLAMADQAMAPSLSDFFRSLERIAAYHGHATEKATGNIVELAIAIARRIHPAAPDLDLEKFADAGKALQKAIAAAHRLNLCLHPDTIVSLKTLGLSNGLIWPSSSCVNLVEDSSLDSESARIEPMPQQMEVLLQRARQCLEALQNVS